MIKLLTVIGARPQIIKAAALHRAISLSFSDCITETIVHTGQHYDYQMSEVFFNELNLPLPNYNLGVGSDSHGKQTARMIEGIEVLLNKEKPDWCVLYGDTNSTLAGAVAAAKLQIPIIHIEAGLRSFDKTMPEELNRICCDHFSTLLFAPTEQALSNLYHEGFSANTQLCTMNKPGVFLSGDVMYDNTLYYADKAVSQSDVLLRHGLQNEDFMLCTVHRSNNTDNTERLNNILRTLFDMAEELHIPLVLPLHPRTKKFVSVQFSRDFIRKLNNSQYVKIIEPVSFLEMILLEHKAKIIITDSGGVQKEAYFMKKPCVILRNTTEWTEIIRQKTGKLVDADTHLIKQAVFDFINNKNLEFPPVFGNGKAAESICKTLVKQSRC